MGWSRGGDIFDPVARKLLHSSIDDYVITDVLVELIDVLYQEDWDCEDESKLEFKNIPPVMEAFRIVDKKYGFDEDED